MMTLTDKQKTLCELYILDGNYTTDEHGIVCDNVYIDGWNHPLHDIIHDFNDLGIIFSKVRKMTIMNCSFDTLKGCPNEVDTFILKNMPNITSLEYGPKRALKYVINNVDIISTENGPTNANCMSILYCRKLEELTLHNLVAQDDEIEEFTMIDCTVKSLDGTPKIVNDITINGCNNLKSLKSTTETVKGRYEMIECKNITSLEEITRGAKEYSLSIWETMFPKFPKEEQEMFRYHNELIELWLKTNMSAKQFLKTKRGYIAGDKFGF